MRLFLFVLLFSISNVSLLIYQDGNITQATNPPENQAELILKKLTNPATGFEHLL